MSEINCNIVVLLAVGDIMKKLLWTFDISCIRVAYAAIVVFTIRIMVWYV